MNIIMISLMVSWAMMNLSKLFKENKEKKKEKSSSFECGFDLQTSKNTMFSSQFFMIALLFIIFDMEITLFIPFIKYEDTNLFKTWNIMILLVLLISGTLLEWKLGMIEWSK